MSSPKEQILQKMQQVADLKKEIKAIILANVPNDHSVGHWDCETSPIGVCVYHPTDYHNDDCVYCGQPDERK